MGHYADSEEYRRSGRGGYSGNRYGYGGRGFTPRFENDYEGQFDDPAFERAGDWRSPGYGDRELHERGLGSNAGQYDRERRYGSGYKGEYRNPRETRSPYPDDFGGYNDYTERRRYDRDYDTGRRSYGYPESGGGRISAAVGNIPKVTAAGWTKHPTR